MLLYPLFQALQGRESRWLRGAQRQHAVRVGRGEDGREEDYAGDIEKAAKGKTVESDE